MTRRQSIYPQESPRHPVNIEMPGPNDVRTNTEGAAIMPRANTEDQTSSRDQSEFQTELYFNHTTPDELVLRSCSVTVMDSTMHGRGGVWISIYGDAGDPTTGVSACFNKEAAEWLLHELGQTIITTRGGNEYVASLGSDGPKVLE